VHRVEEGGLPDWLSKYGLQHMPLQPTHSPRTNQGRVKSKEQSLKADARSFRNFLNYRIRILFFCGGLDLFPSIYEIP
jgi:hypothetical protein